MKTKYLVAWVLFLLILVNIGTIWNFWEIALWNYYITHGEYEKAINWFSQRQDHISKLNLGITYYKQWKFQKALTSYEALIKSKVESDILFASHANAGNANYFIGESEENPTSKKVEWKNALAHYLEALKIKKDAQVEENYQTVLALLEKLDSKVSPQQSIDQSKSNQNWNIGQNSQDEKNQSSKQSWTGQQNQSSSENNNGNWANWNSSQENSNNATTSGSKKDLKNPSQSQNNQASSSSQSSSGNLLQKNASWSLSPTSNSGAISEENTSQSHSGSTATGSWNSSTGSTLKPDTSWENQLSPSQLDALEEYQKWLMDGQKDAQEGFNKVYQDPANQNQIFQMFGNPFFDNSLLNPDTNEKNW